MTGVEPAVALLQLSDWEFVFANLDYLAGGIVLTILLTIASVVLGFLVGFPAGIIEVYGGRWSTSVVSFVGIVLRGTPILVILIFTFFVLPITDWIAAVLPLGSAFVAGILGLGLRSAAYQSQIFRGAIQSVGEGQVEAARSIGMSQLQAIRYVVVPQSLRRSIPSFQNEFTIVLKDTSIVIVIGISELLTRANDLFTQQTSAVLEVFLFASAVYFVLTFATNRGLDYLQDFFAIPTGESA